MTKKVDISVVIPTFKRPDGLKNALSSLNHQTIDDKVLNIEVIVSDNDPNGSAKEYVKRTALSARFPIHYVHAKIAGVSNARNAALECAKGRYIMFLDDDQVASPTWMEGLYQASVDFKAGIVFGKITAVIDCEPQFDPILRKLFSRQRQDQTNRVIEDVYGCGNSLIDCQLCPFPEPVFSPALNEVGGEDDLLFNTLVNQGAVIAWSETAWVDEIVPPNRSTLAYIKQRSFARGQGPTQTAYDHSKYISVLKWMCIGSIQFPAFKLLSVFAKLTGQNTYINYEAKSIEGLGKILWQERFCPKLYGQALMR